MFRLRPRRGASLLDYGLIAVLIAVVSIGIISTVGGLVASPFDSAQSALNGEEVAEAPPPDPTPTPTASPPPTPTPTPGPTYVDTLLAQNPLAYWRLGETSGTVAVDASGNGSNATYIGSPSLGVAGLLGGDADSAVNFPADATNYVQTPTLASLGTAYSLTAWVLPDVSSSGVFLSSGSSRPYLRHNTNVIIFAFINSVGGLVSFNTPSASAPLGTPVFVVATHDGSTARIYINGVERALSATAAQAPGAVSLNIGRTTANTLPFDGTVDEVAVFGRALSAAEVAELYAARGN